MALNGPYNNAIYTYDALDHLTQIEVNDGGWTQAHKQFRTFSYDGYGRTVSETTPEAGTVTYTYTANDLIATKTDARGKTVTMTYNTRNLVTGMSYNDSGATPSVTYGYDVFGAQTLMTDGEGVMTYHFNSYRQLDYETRTFTALTGQSFTLNYTYNKADLLTRVNYVASSGFNKNINYAYNSTGALTGVGTNLIGTDPNATTNVVSNLSYNGFGATKSLNYGNGRRLTLGYNVNCHQMTSMVVDNQNGTDAIISKAYAYWTVNPDNGQPNLDNDGRIKKITDSVDSGYTTTYSYDEFNRLTRAQATTYDRLYSYDRFGNLTQVSSAPGVVMQTLNLVQGTGGYALNNRLANVNGNITYGYDAAGNVTQEGSTTYTYDADARLKEMGSGGQNVYGYDGDGKRVRKVENGGTALYYVRSIILKEVAMEVNQAQGVSRAYVRAGNQLVAEQSADGTFNWLHNDHLGSSRKLTNTSGAVVYRGEFDPFGQALLETGSTTLNSHKYTGYERDATSGLDYANARMYNSTRGRFTMPDPAGLSAANASPQSLNRYSYVFNDPVNHVDPSGLLTIIIGGTGNGDADWGQPGTEFNNIVSATFGELARVFPWSGQFVTFLSGYAGIIQGSLDLADFINHWKFEEGEKLNIVAHSHGGNLVKIASWLIKRPIDNLVTLGTPQNFDLPDINPSAVSNYCNVSSLEDPFQFAGASPIQLYYTGLYAGYSVYLAAQATWALFNGDFWGAAYYSGESAKYLAASALWYLSTKIDPYAHNVILGSESHSDLHTVATWNRIKGGGACNLPTIPLQSRSWPVGPTTTRPRSR